MIDYHDEAPGSNEFIDISQNEAADDAPLQNEFADHDMVDVVVPTADEFSFGNEMDMPRDDEFEDILQSMFMLRTI